MADISLKIERWKIERVLPYARNARLHSSAQVDQIAASIQEFGFVNPVLVDAEGTLVAGHGRILAGQKLALAVVPVIRLGHLTAEQSKALRLADNAIALHSAWDETLLNVELVELSARGFDLGLTGFLEDEIQALLHPPNVGEADPNVVPPVPAHPVVRKGDMWKLGSHRLLCGDSTDKTDVGRILNGAKPHLMVTDPPYGVDYDPTWRERDLDAWKKPTSIGLVANDGRADWSAAWLLFPGDVAYTWCPPGNAGAFGGKRGEGDEWTGHGTQKPVECMRRPIENNSKRGDYVYEPFCGSGTTIVAGEMTGRRVLAIELDPAYVEVAVTRWEKFTGKRATLEGKPLSQVRKQRAIPSGD